MALGMMIIYVSVAKPEDTLLALAGTTVTIWALFLSMAIYLLSARDTSALFDKIDDLREQLSQLLPDEHSQEPSELSKALDEYADYVYALQKDIGIPREDVVSVVRPGSGKGNRPLVIDTRLGKRYSVFRGGRGKSGYTVTKLDPLES